VSDPREDLETDLLLELRHLLAHRRLRDVQPLRGAREAALAGYGEGIADLAELHDASGGRGRADDTARLRRGPPDRGTGPRVT
jgi:hypothetical protein